MTTTRAHILASIILTFSTATASSEILKIVAPSGVEDRDGSTFIPGATSPFKAQELYLSSDFESLPEGGAWLVATAERADTGQRRSVNVAYDDVQITFGTTTENNLAHSFAENLGASAVTVVDGSVELTYEIIPESPNPFSATWQFDTPYFYDPAAGNLVVDLTTSSGADRAVRLDSQRVSEFRGNGGGPNSTRANMLYANSFIQQFTFVPVGDINFDGAVDATDVDALTPGPFDLNGDFVIDESDRTFWVEEIVSTWFGDSNLDGEFNSGDLVDVFKAAKYELDIDAAWSDGDWNGDRRFDSGDLVVAFKNAGYERGPRAAAHAVPEPSSLLLFIPIVLAVIRRRLNS